MQIKYLFKNYCSEVYTSVLSKVNVIKNIHIVQFIKQVEMIWTHLSNRKLTKVNCNIHIL